MWYTHEIPSLSANLLTSCASTNKLEQLVYPDLLHGCPQDNNQYCHITIASVFLGQPYNMSDSSIKFVRTCQKLVNRLASTCLAKCSSSSSIVISDVCIVFQNIHLVAKWLSTLEKTLEAYSEGSHENYRVYMSAEPAGSPDSHIIPQGILESSIKITNEPPTGMLANLHQALDNFNQVGVSPLWRFCHSLDIDILQQPCYQQADIRTRSHGLRQLVHEKSVASCQQACCKLIVKTCYPRACCKLF